MSRSAKRTRALVVAVCLGQIVTAFGLLSLAAKIFAPVISGHTPPPIWVQVLICIWGLLILGRGLMIGKNARTVIGQPTLHFKEELRLIVDTIAAAYVPTLIIIALL